LFSGQIVIEYVQQKKWLVTGFVKLFNMIGLSSLLDLNV